MVTINNNGMSANTSSGNMGMKSVNDQFHYWLLRTCVQAFFIAGLFLYVLPSAVFAAGGAPEWQYRDAQPGSQTAMAAAVDPVTGEMVITGYTDSNGDDFYTVKINAAGDGLAWTAPAFDINGGEDRAVAVGIDSEGNVIVLGHVTNSSNNIDFYTVKYNGATGAVIWAKTYGGTSNGDDFAVALAIDYLNNIYVGGFTPGSNGKDDCLLIKYSPDGSRMWVKTYNNDAANDHDRITAVTAGPDGVAFTGRTFNATESDILTVKYDFFGGKVWDTVRPGTYGNDEGVAVDMDSAGHVIVTGTVLNATLNNDIYTVKYDGAGGTVIPGMEKVYSDPNGGSDQARALIVDEHDDIYVTGSTFTVSGLTDFVTIRYSGVDGTEDWKPLYSSGGNNTDIPTAMVVNEVSIYVTGYTHKAAAGDDDFTTVKYKKDNGSEQWPTAATYNNDTVNKDDVTVYIGLDMNGKVYVAGWSNKSPTAALDYDYYGIRYDPGDLNTPTGLTAATVDESTIGLSWTDNSLSPNETEFQIWRKVGADVTYAQIDTVGQDETTYQDNGLAPHVKYYYQVRGYSSTIGEYSHFSNEVYAKTTVVTINANPSWLFRYNGPDNSDDVARDIGVGPDFDPVVTGYSTIAAGFDYYTVKLRHTLVASDSNSVTLDLNGDGLADIRADFTTALGADSTVVLNTTLGGAVTAGTHTGDAAGNTTLKIISVPENNEHRINRDATGITLSWDNTGKSWTLTNNGGYAGAAILDGYVGQLWDDHYDDPGNAEDMGQCLIVNDDNEVVVTGTSFLFSLIYGSTNDIYTMEYPATGPPAIGDPFNWDNQYNGIGGGNDYPEAIDTSSDGSNNIAIVGYGQNATTDEDIYVLYFLEDGTRLWVDEYSNPWNHDRPAAVTFDPAGDIIMTGWITAGGDADIITRKYCAAGTSAACAAAGKNAGEAIWTVIHDSGNGADKPSGIVADSRGDVYVAGYIANPSGNRDTYIVKLSGADGSEAWGAPIIEDGPAHGDDQVVAIEMDLNDDEFVVASTWKLGAGNNEFRMTRYTADGVVVWDHLLDSPATDDKVQAMGMDVSGNFCVSGTTGSGGTTDILAVKYDYRGEILGATRFDGGQTPALSDEPVAVAVNRLGEAFVAGNTSKAVGGFDYMVMLCEGDVLQAPAPFEVTPYYLTAEMSWANNSPAADGFTLEAKVGACPIIATDATWQQSFGPGVLNHTETGLAMGQTYCFRLKTSISSTGEDSRWLYREVTTSKPPAPGSLSAEALNSTRIQLSWLDTITGEEGFRVERCDDTAGNCGTADANFTYLGAVAAGSTSYDDATVCPGLSYTYRVRAMHALWGEEPLWAYADAATPSPTAPAIISITQQSEGRLDISWSDTNPDETGFYIYRCAGAGCTINVAADTPVAVVNAPADSLVSLKMDEGSWTPGSPDVLDSSGNGNHGTAYNEANRGVFDGDDDYVTLGDMNDLDAPGAFSVELRFRRDDETALATNHGINNVLVAQSSAATNDNFEIGTQGSYIELYLDSASDVNETKTVELGLAVDAGIEDSAWYHLVFTYDKDAGDTFEAKLYLDGALLAQWDDPDGLLAGSSTSPLTIGMARPDGEAVTPTGLWGDFKGEIDEVTIYNRALSGAEVAAYYANGNIPASYADTLLDPNQTYRYLVTPFKTTSTTCGTDPGWEGGASGYDQGTTTGLAAPVLLSAVADTVENTSSVNLSWQDNTEFEENFIVERCNGNCSGSFVVNDSLTAPANPGKGGTVNWTDATACSGTYTYRVRAVRTTAPVWTTATSAAELAATTVSPAAPVMISATRQNEEDILLSWADTTNDETGFTVERCIGGSCREVHAPAQAGTGTVNFTDTRLTPYTTYDYRVKAVKDGGCSWDTAFTTPQVQANTDIVPAISLSASLPNTTRIDLSWNDPTAHETGFVLERCEGDCSVSFTASQSHAFAAGVTYYSDTSVCEGTQYSYRVKAIDQDFDGGMNGCWTRRQKLAITPFTPDTVIDLTVNFVAGQMQDDFDDVRFYSFTDASENDGGVIPHAIASKTDGVSARVILRTPASGDFLYMYHGNMSATAVEGSYEELVTFSDDFQGTVIDTDKWIEIDPNGQISQNNGLQLNYLNTSWDAALISNRTFARQAGNILIMKVQPQNGASSDYFMSGWEIDQTTDPNHTQMVHGIYWPDFTNILLYTKGTNRGYSNATPYSANTEYILKIVLLATGADYYLKGGAYTDWRWIGKTTYYSDDPLRIGIHQNRHQARISLFGVIEPAHPAVNLNVEPDVACDPLGMPLAWESDYSAVVTPIAAEALEPTFFQAEALSESEIKLTWQDNTLDDTGFILERCQGSDAACVAVTQPNFDWSKTVPGPVNPSLLLHMDEAAWGGAANEVKDSAGSNHGIAYNGATTTTGGVNGSRAGLFDTSDYVALNSGFTLNRFGSTLSWWQKPSTTADTGLFANNPSGGSTSIIESRSSMIYAETNLNCNQFSFGAIPKTTNGAWYTIVFNNEHAYLYIDGAFVKEATEYGTNDCAGPAVDHMLADTTLRYIGAPTAYVSTNYRGLLDEVAVFGYALSPSDIAYLYGSFEEYIDTGLSLSTEYTYRLRAFKDSSSCTWMTDDTVRTTVSTLAPPPPTNLSANPINTTRIDLGWDDNTGSNTAFTIERSKWNGGSYDPPVFIGPAEGNDLNYSDTEVCEDTQYRYRVRAAKESFVIGGGGLSGDGGDTWSRRAPVTIAGFQPDTVTEITVLYDPDMQPDFDDLRFFDATAVQELPHYIVSRVDSDRAQVLFKSGANDTVTMYYGNLSAADTSNGPAIFEFYDDFAGTTIDGGKWLENDVNNKITQNDGLYLAYINNSWDSALFSQQTFNRVAGKTLLMQINIQNGAGNDYFGIGWTYNQTGTLSYSNLRHGFYWNNFSQLLTYNPWFYGPAYTAGDYLLKVELKAAGAKYYVQGGPYSELTLLTENASYSDNPVRIQIAQYSQQAKIDLVAVYQAGATATLGTEERGQVANGWETDYDEATAKTDPMVTPTLNTVSRISETRIDIAWTDLNNDESNLELERCIGASCTTFLVPGGTSSYSDAGLLSGTTYCYRIRARKDGTSCNWETPYHPALPADALCADTSIIAPVLPPTVGATTDSSNTTRAHLEWTDNSESESGFIVWRCADDTPLDCSNDANFTDIHIAGPNQTSWNDDTVCSGQTYTYKIEALSDGLAGDGFSNSGGGSWTKRRHLSFDAFVPNSTALVTVAYDSDMQPDFDDLRFVDASDGAELEYTINSKTDGTQATIWFKTGSSDAINMYYGNTSATASAGSDLPIFAAAPFYRDFQGTTINTEDWAVIDPNGQFTQNNALQLNYVDASWNAALISKDIFSRTPGTMLYMRLRPENGASSDSFMAGWEVNQTANPSYTQLIYGLYWPNFGNLLIFEKGSNRSYTNAASYSADTDYEMKIELKSLGALYYIRGGAYPDWKFIHETNNYSDTPLRIGITQNSHQAKIYTVAVATSPVVTVGAEEIPAVEIWNSARSSSDSATTALYSQPAMDQVNTRGLTETTIQVAWTDINPDESYFRIYRGAADCTGFTEIGQTAGPDIFTFTDTGADLAGGQLPYNTTYCYQVQAHKETGYCNWDSLFNTTATAATDIPAPAGFAATATETTRIELIWTDTSTSETGYIIERCDGNKTWCDADPDNRFAYFTSVGAGIDYYSDTAVCPVTVYTYRVKATRSGEWTSPPSETDDAITAGPPVLPEDLALTEVYDQENDLRQIDLAWTDTNPDEDGFMIERCDQTLHGDCDTADTNFSVIGTIRNNDAFTSGIDTTIWKPGSKLGANAWNYIVPVDESDTTGGGKISWNNGAAVFEATSTGTGSAGVWNQTLMQLVDPASLGSGDFDVQFDWELPTVVMPESVAQYHVHVRMQINAGVDALWIERSVDSTNGSRYWSRIRINGSDYDLIDPSADTKGRFRMTRIGNALTVYYWDWAAKDWRAMNTRTGAGLGSVPSLVAIRQYAQQNEAAAVKAVVDNFRINSQIGTAYQDIDSLAPSNDYYYRVRAFKETACPAWDNLYTLKENELTNPAATTLTAASAGSRKIRLTWPDNATDEDGYEIERVIFGGKFIQIGDVAPNTMEYIDSVSLDPDTTYTYRIRSYRDNYTSFSAYSNEASAKTDVFGGGALDDTTCE